MPHGILFWPERRATLDFVHVLFQESRQEFTQKEFLTRSRKSAIPQGNPKIGRGVNSCALKAAGVTIDSKGEMSLVHASHKFKE
jgi:hypothetical protein